MTLDEHYYEATGINIGEQERIWDERGKGYYGEYLVFKTLYTELQGYCKILMNLEIPNSYGNTTELDLVLIHETGIYVFEMKHYKGIIYGTVDQPTWTQYFRASKNSVFDNPLLQNRYHIDTLKRLLPSSEIKNIVCFTNHEVTLRIDGYLPKDTYIGTLEEISSDLKTIISGFPINTPEKIDEIFRYLAGFSKWKAPLKVADGTVVNLNEYLSQIIRNVQNYKQTHTAYILQKQSELEADYSRKAEMCVNAAKRKTEMCVNAVEGEKKKYKKKCLLLSMIACISMIFMSSCVSCISCATAMQARDERTLMEKERDSMAKNFTHVDNSIGSQYADILGYVTVNDVSLTKSSEFQDSSDFAFTLNSIHAYSQNAYADVSEAVIIVQLYDGTVSEFNLEIKPYSNDVITARNTFKNHLYGILPDEIQYIKLRKIFLSENSWSNSRIYGVPFELELYKAN